MQSAYLVRSKKIVRFSTFAAILCYAIFANADTFVLSDTEGSTEKIDAFVQQGKLRWITVDGVSQLDLVNKTDSLVFLGDLSGPNWSNPENPLNIKLRDALLGLKNRYPKQVDLVMGNHEFNRLTFVRENIRIERGENPEYKKWLKSKGVKDSARSRVSFWGEGSYGVNKEGIALPLSQYQIELSNRAGKAVSLDDAAKQFVDDLKVGKPGEPHGKMLQYILAAQESSVRDGYAFTHAPIVDGNVGMIPPSGKKVRGGATWLIRRNNEFFRPELEAFIKSVQEGKVPRKTIAELGDARLDSVAKRVVSDFASISYTERARDGDNYLGIDKKVAAKFARDKKNPVRMIFSGHKPAGNFATAHQQLIDGEPFYDVVVDTSRGPHGSASTTTIKPDGSVEVVGLTSEGKTETWIIGEKGDPLVGRINDDGFHIKGKTSDQRYILERYVGYGLEEKIVASDLIDPKKVKYSVLDPRRDRVLLAKVRDLQNAIRTNGGTVLNDFDEAARIVGDRFILDVRGASNWAAVDSEKAAEIRKTLQDLAKRLDPRNVIIMTGGNRAPDPNAVETMAHDIFAGEGVKKKFDIIGVMKHDTPADEVDKAVKFVVLNGEGGDWDGPVKAAQKFVSERRGATLMFGGGGVLKRAVDSTIAATMKDRMLLVQGYGGASEEKALKGTAVRSVDEIVGKLSSLQAQSVPAKPAAPKQLKIGIYTGSFDPPHVGHKHIVDEMKKRFGLDVVYVVPDSTVAYKPGMQSLEVRKDMVALTFKDDPSIKVLSPEMQKAIGSGEMWDTVAAIRDSNKGAKLYNIMGTDTLQWYQGLPPERQNKDVTLLVNMRDRSAVLPSTVAGTPVVGVEMGDAGISSTIVRNEIKSGVASAHLVPAVQSYIAEKKLYGIPATAVNPCPDSFAGFVKPAP